MRRGSSSQFEVAFTGKTAVGREGAYSGVSGTPNRTLLAVLALRPSDLCTTDRLIDWLWSDKSPANPKGALYTRVSRLRDALGEARGLVVSANDGYRLDASRSQIDVYAYEAAVTDEHRTLDTMLAADQLWKGRPFADVTPIGAIEDEATRLTQLWLVGRHELTERLIDADRLSEAAALCDSTLREEPFDEPTMGLLLRLAELGQRSRDIGSRYDQWRKRFVDSFGVAPPAYLDELADQLQPVSTSAPPSDLGVVFDLAAKSTVFGRQAADIIESAQQMTVVTGPTGIGKTLMAAHWRRRRLESGERVEVVSGAHLLDWIAGQKGTVDYAVVIEDLDEYEGGETTDKLVASLAGIPALFATSRPVPPGHPAFALIAHLGRFQGAAIWQPGMLDDDEVRDMVVALDPQHVDAVEARHIAQQVLQITGGLPSACDLVLRSTMRHNRRIVPHRLIGAGAARTVVEYLGSGFQRLKPLAQQCVALSATTVGDIGSHEMGDLVEQLRQRIGVDEPFSSTDISDAVIDAQGSGLAMAIPPDQIKAIGSACTWVVRQFGPELLAHARHVMHQRALAAGDIVDQAFSLLLDPSAPEQEVADTCAAALRRLAHDGNHTEIVDCANQALRDPRLARASNLDACRDVAEIHLITARSAESQGWRSVADHHWDSAFELGVKCGSDQAVGEAAAAAGRFGRNETDAPSGRRLAAARAWADRHGSTDTQVMLEIEDQRRMTALGRHISHDRLDALRHSLATVSPVIRAEGWAAVAAALLAYPLTSVTDQLDHAFDRVDECLDDVADEPARRGVSEMSVYTLRAARALRQGDVDAAEELIERGYGAALYRRHPRRSWLALLQRATLSAMGDDEVSWQNNIRTTMVFGCSYQYADVGAVGAAHLVHATKFNLKPPDFDSHILGLIDAPLSIDLGDKRAHPAARLGVMAFPGSEPERDAFDRAWKELHRQRTNAFTLSALVYAAWAAQRVEAEGCYADVAEALTQFKGEYATLPVGVAPVGAVDDVISAIS